MRDAGCQEEGQSNLARVSEAKRSLAYERVLQKAIESLRWLEKGVSRETIDACVNAGSILP